MNYSHICRLLMLAGMASLAGCTDNASPSTSAVPSSGVGATAPAESAKPGLFEDVTAQSGVNFTFRNGESGHYAILESLGGGVGLIDYDRDGLLDIMIAGGGHYDDKKNILGHPNRLFHNDGNFRFHDVTAEVGLPAENGPMYSHGISVGDYDNDGWPDILVTGYGRVALYRNNKGKFEEVTEKVGLPSKHKVGHWSTSAAWCDFDGDGHVDLFLEHYTDWSWDKHPHCGGANGEEHDVCSPKQFYGIPDQLFMSNGNGTFRETGKAAGLRQNGVGNDKGLGCLVVDVNDDGKPDIYVANDTTENYLYINQGGGKFKEVGIEAGVSADEKGTPNGSMGVDAGDYDGSGRMSIFVTNYQHETHALYRNRGTGVAGYPTFHYSSDSAGIRAIGTIYVGFGTGFIDYDNDGNEDIFISNGHVVYHPPTPGTVKQRPVLLRNMRKPGQEFYAIRFKNVTDEGGPFFHQQHVGRGVAFGDLNNDGKTDLVICHTNHPVAILKNNVQNGNHWLGVELMGKPNRDAVGAKLTLEVGERKFVKQIKGGRSYLSSHDLRQVFGLGKETTAGKLTVRWPSGKVQTWESLPIDKYSKLEEGVEKPK